MIFLAMGLLIFTNAWGIDDVYVKKTVEVAFLNNVLS